MSDEAISRHYQQTIAALAETIQLMAAIDETIEAYGGWPLTGSAETAATAAT